VQPTNGEAVQQQATESAKPVPAISKSGTPAQQAISKAGPGVQRSKTNSKGDILCWECRKYGHIAVACPERKGANASKRANSKPVLVATQHPGNQLVL